MNLVEKHKLVFISMKRNRYNVLFLSLLDYNTLDDSNIYTDLLKEFVENGHYVTAISPVEKRNYTGQNNVVTSQYSIIKPLIGDIQKTGLIKKGISTILLEGKIISEIKKLQTIFDIVIYSTPPVTFARCIKYLKKRDNVTSYLLLKDIFPQNAVDLGILSKQGFTAPIYFYFRNKEKKLYQLSNYIGCMSEANKTYIINNNKIDVTKVEVNPNTEKVTLDEFKNIDKNILFDKYSIPKDKTIFIYGGNLGKPQGISFLKQCITSNENRENTFFLIIGSGTEYNNLENYIKLHQLINVKLLPKMEKKEFELLVKFSDVGLIFLDYRFTIPNFPSRLLTYMKMSKPVLLAVDKSTDIGKIAKENGFGDYCLSNDVSKFDELIDKYLYVYDKSKMGKCAYNYFINNYSSNISYELIIKKVEK